VRYGDSEFHYPTDGSGLIVDRNAFQARERISASLEVSRFVKQAVQGLALFTLNRSAGGIDDRLDNSADTLGFYAFVSDGVVSRGSADLRANFYLVPAATATAGVQIERQSEGSSSESLSQFGASVDSVDVERTTRGYYAQLQLEPSRQTTLVGGLRVDDSETFGTFVTYRGGATARLGSGSVLRGSVGRGFKEPTFFENFANSPFVVGNPDLEPERSTSLDAGFEQQLHGRTITLGATYFDQRFEDLIQYDAAPADQGDPNYVNVAAARSAGVELEARVLMSSWFSLRSNYTYLHTEVTDAGLDTGPDAGFVEGERLLRRPTHRAGLNVRYSAPGLGNLAFSIHHVGNREDRDFSSSPVERVELPAYTKVDLAGELIVLRSRGQFPGLRLTARVENLFDRNYQEVVGFPARGRVILVGGRFGKF
jgi:vitamin B12 transporter